MSRLHHSVLGPGLAIGFFCAFSTACTSGGTRSAAVGSRTERISVSGRDYSTEPLEITTEASVLDSMVAAAPAAVWSALPTVFELLRIETSTVDAGSLVIGNPRFIGGRIEGKALSTYVDCGNTYGGPTADRYQVTLYLMVGLSGPFPGGGTMVRTVMDASARPRDVMGNSLHCVSKGTLERRIVELVTEMAGASNP